MRKNLHRLTIFLLVLSLVFSIFFLFKVRERNKFINELIDISVKSKDLDDVEQIVISVSREIYKKTNKGLIRDELDLYSRVESLSFFNVTSAVSLRYGGFGIIGHTVYGPCGTMSRTLLNALWKLKIPARKLQLLNNEIGKGGGHTIIEFYHDDDWRVISPSDSTFVWRTENGEIASAKQIHDDPTIFSQIYRIKPNYRYLFDNYSNVRWEKLPQWVTCTIRFVIGERRFNSAETPKLYDLPRSLLLYCSISSLILCSIFVWIFKSK